MNTAAWQSLNATQRAIYLEMVARYAGPGSNNGKLLYSVREAAESLHIGKTTAADALLVLQQRGFVVPTTKGAFSRKVRHATEWRLTEFPCDVTHALPSKEFAKWSPEIQNTVRLQTSTVPETGPIGTHSGTEAHEKAPDGTCSGTVEPQNSNSRYLWPDTISLPGASLPSLFLLNCSRSAPPKVSWRASSLSAYRANWTQRFAIDSVGADDKSFFGWSSLKSS